MVTASADVVEAVSVAIEAAISAYYANESIKALDRMLDVAEAYYVLYYNQQQIIRTLMYDETDSALPMLINEMDAIIYRTPDYATRILDFWDNTGAFVQESFGSGPFGDWYNSKKHKHLGEAYTFGPYYLFEQENIKLESDWTNYMFRFEEMMVDTENDINFQKKLNVMNLGIRQGNAVSSTLQNSLDNYQEQLNNSAEQLATYANGIAQYIGYNNGRKSTSEDIASSSQYTENNLFSQSATDMWAYQPSGQLA